MRTAIILDCEFLCLEGSQRRFWCAAHDPDPVILPVLSSAINWEEIEQQYDEMVKYTAAMQTRTADPEAILRRFARAEVMHPAYKALSELGRASRRSSCSSIFVWRRFAGNP